MEERTEEEKQRRKKDERKVKEKRKDENIGGLRSEVPGRERRKVWQTRLEKDRGKKGGEP